MAAQEGEERVELLGQRHAHVELPQSSGGGGRGGFVHGDIFGVGETEPCEVGDVTGLRGAKEKGLARAGESSDDGVERGTETHVENAVGFVEHEQLHVVEVEANGLVHVLQHAAGRAHEDVHAVEGSTLFTQTTTTNDKAGGEGVFPADAAEDLEDLGGELAGGRDDEGAEAVEGGPFFAVEELKHGDEEGEGLSRAGFGGAEDIAALQGWQEGPALDVSERLEVRLVQTIGSLLGEGELGKVGGLQILRWEGC